MCRDLAPAFRIVVAERNCVRPLLQTFAPDGETVAIPVQNFHPVLAPACKHKQVPGEGVQLQVLADQRLQTVEALAHIARRKAEVHPHAGWQVDHLRSASSTVRKVVISTPGPMRNRSPVANTSSSAASAMRSGRRAPLSTRAKPHWPVFLKAFPPSVKGVLGQPLFLA